MVVIVDLDGTLVTCNSFTEFVKFMFRRHGRLRLRLGWTVILRKMRLISHHEAKERIVALCSATASEKDINDFTEYLTKKVNPRVMSIVQAADRRVLATAAPSIYAVPLAKKLDIGECVATEPGYGENMGELKLRNVQETGVVFSSDTVVITDHYDDLPLLRANADGRNYIVMSDKTLKISDKRLKINYEAVHK